MCAQIYLNIQAHVLAKKFGLKISEKFSDETFEKMVHGYLKTEKTPVVVFMGGKLQIQEMYFSLCPSWSKEFPCSWSTYNARMERPQEDKKTKNLKTQYIYEILTWRDVFSKGQTCLVPMSGAIESSYFGSHAGNRVRFSEKNDGIFYALGIWSEWIDQKSGEVKESFALLTDDPYEFFFKAGHDRSILLIEEKMLEKWLLDKEMTPQERFNFIRKARVSCDWKVEVEKPMKAGWEKRAPSLKEISEIAFWK